MHGLSKLTCLIIYSEDEIMLMSNFVNENKEKLFGRADGHSSAKIGSLTKVHISQWRKRKEQNVQKIIPKMR